jgi:DNA polymerase II large subunit
VQNTIENLRNISNQIDELQNQLEELTNENERRRQRINNSEDRSILEEDEAPETSQNTHQVQIKCPKCTARFSSIEFSHHYNNCEYRTCRFCKEYYPKSIIREHRR